MTIKAILFDLDGVISDTHLIHYEAYRQALWALYQLEMPLDEYNLMGSIPTRGRTKYLCDHGTIENDPQKIHSLHLLKKQYTQDMIESMGIDTRLQDFLSKGKELYNLRYAVASNASDAFVNNMLAIKGITSFFDSVTGSYSITRSKPNPMMYLNAMVKLNVAPNESIVIEDSSTGIVAGYRSGAFVYRVSTPLDVNDDLLDTIGQMQ